MCYRSLSFSLLVSVFLVIPSFAQRIKIKSPIREIRFADMFEEENKPFSRKNQELLSLIFRGIEEGKIAPLEVDFSGKKEPTKLSHEEWIRKIAQKNTLSEEEFEIYQSLFPSFQILFPTDFRYLGIDVTYGRENKDVCQVNYIHFYPAEHFSETEKREYRFSVQWNDVLSYINEFPQLLWYNKSWEIFWRGEALVTSEWYAIDYHLGPTLIDLSKKTHALPARDTTGKLIDFSSHPKRADNFYDIYLRERKDSDGYSLEKIGFAEYAGTYPFAEIRRFEFSWVDLRKIMKDSGWTAKQPVMTLHNALQRNMFAYSDTTEVISKSGKYMDGRKDPVCSKKIEPSFTSLPFPAESSSFSVDYVESISTKEILNKDLASIPPSIYEYVLSGKLTPYFNDSLNRAMNMEELKNAAGRYFTADVFNDDSSYRAGDIVKDWSPSGNWQFYIAKQDVSPNSATPNSSAAWEAYQPPVFPASGLNLIEIKHHVRYGQDGRGKQYDIQGLGLYIPHDADINELGIVLPICYVNWEDLKPFLQPEFVDLLEERQFFSFFLKTSVLKP